MLGGMYVGSQVLMYLPYAAATFTSLVAVFNISGERKQVGSMGPQEATDCIWDDKR